MTKYRLLPVPVGNATGRRHRACAGLHEAREKTTAILEPLGAEDCHRPVVANYPPDATVISLLIHVTTHYAYHTGQVISLTKQSLADDDRLLEWEH